MDVARVLRPGGRVGLALLVGEDRDQPPVARVEVEVALLGTVQVWLLEDERHPEHPLPEVDRRLAVGAGEGYVVDPLRLELAHVVHPSGSPHQSRAPSTSSRGFSPRLGAPMTKIAKPAGPAS